MVDQASDTVWPSDYINAVNTAVNRALSDPLQDVLSTLSEIGGSFRSASAFVGRRSELGRSILRNKMIAATISSDTNVENLINEVLAEMENSGLFDDGELQFQRSVVAGKLRSL
jgi:hypothetical protein